jgi:hypothetical protein
MPIILNSRREKFAQEYARGKSATEAMKNAGYSDPRNSTRLKKNDEIRRRIEELQTAVAKNTVISIETICAELDEANQVAKERGQAAAMVSASTLRARLAGLLRDRVEISNTNQFNQCESMTELAEALLREQGCLAPTQPQIEQAVAICESFHADLEAVAMGRAPITIDTKPINVHRQRAPRLLTRATEPEG